MASKTNEPENLSENAGRGGQSVPQAMLADLSLGARTALEGIDSKSFRAAVELLTSVEKVFVLGVGHSGAIAKTLTMKLAHVGLVAYPVFAEIIPPFGADSLLVAVSQSGETTTVVTLAEKARRLGGRVLAITGNSGSRLARLSDCVLGFAPTPPGSEVESLRGLGTGEQQNVRGAVFGLALYALGYSLIVSIAELRKESPESIGKRHANLE